MSGFHQLRVRQRIIFKRYVCKGFRKWFIDAGIIAEGSADMALKGRRYYRNMRLLKKSFSVLVQYRVGNFSNNYKNLGEEFQPRLENISNETSIDEVISCNEFNDIYNNIVQTYGTESVTTVSYLHDVSSLLALLRSVRVSDFELHMQAERDMLKYCFAFDHVNYARYLTFQHVLLSTMANENRPAIIELKTKGFGATFTGNQLSTIHGDLVTEVFNGQTKRQAGPHRLGFSKRRPSK